MNMSLQIFIVFIIVIILLLMFYLIKRRKPEILHHWALHYTNCDESEQGGDDGSLQSKAAKPSVLVHNPICS